MTTMTAPLNRAALNAQITSHKNLSYFSGLSESMLEDLKSQVLRYMIGLDEHQMLEILEDLDRGQHRGFRVRLAQG